MDEDAELLAAAAALDIDVGRSIVFQERIAPYRSYPAEPDELERLAFRARISDDELRQYLRREIEQRRNGAA